MADLEAAAGRMMDSITLRRVDDGRLISVEAAAAKVPPMSADQSAYEAGYRRVVDEHELPAGRARIFETGGAFILVVRTADSIQAFDAQPLMVTERTPHLLRAQRFLVDPGGQAAETHQLVPLAVTIEDDWVWVDVEES